MLIDAHAHLDDKAFSRDRGRVIEKVRDQGIVVINAGCDIPTSRFSVELAQEHDFIFACVGIHPHEAKGVSEGYIDTIKELAAKPKVVAIGEIGLDYHYDFSDRATQKKVFWEQLQLAKQLDIPVVIHDREAHQDTLEILKKSGIKKGLMHCFSGSLDMAKKLMKLEFYFSFGGPITFKNAKRPKEVAANLPLETIILETDCPYLTPEPHRGRRNDPTMVKFVAQSLANLKRMPFEDIQSAVNKNTIKLFSIPG